MSDIVLQRHGAMDYSVTYENEEYRVFLGEDEFDGFVIVQGGSLDDGDMPIMHSLDEALSWIEGRHE